MNIRFLILGLAVALLLSACGFTPRGSLSSTTDLGAIFVDAPREVPIAALLRQEILNRNLNLTENRDQANVLIRLTQESQSQRILSVQSTGRVSEYELRHSVNLLVAQGENKGIARYNPDQKANTVTVQREYTYDDTGVLGKEDEASILRKEMREELARHLMLRVVATTRL
ncbi:MAG: hypothetical protein KTR32_42275 [Granulosicoccus sp.]|nr:hypothetical protein [Granulosicoccus sp.]